MASLPRALATVLVTGLLLAVSACGGSGSGAPVMNVHMGGDDDGMYGAMLAKPYRLPDVRLTSSNGTPYAVRSDTTKPLTLVFFGYTNCPDICQVVMADITSAVSRLDKADQAKVGMLFVTTDPARDTPTVLRAYVDRFNPAFRGLTGPLPTIQRLGTALGVPIAKGARLPTGGYDVSHGTQVIGVLANGKAPIVWTYGTSSAKIAADVAMMLDGGMNTAAGNDSGSGS